jgi:hypothetical protein
MEVQRAQWEFMLQTDPGLKERLRRLDAAGKPATKKGDLLCLAVKGETPLVVSFNGAIIQVERREAKNPFCLWTMDRKQFNRLFFEDRPPILVAMNNDQSNIKMGADHHHGSLVLSLLVMLQECGELQ